MEEYFINPPDSYEPHPLIGGIQCYRRKCRIAAADLGSCPGWYSERVRGNFCIVKYEYGYLVFDGVFSVFGLTGACYEKVIKSITLYSAFYSGKFLPRSKLATQVTVTQMASTNSRKAGVPVKTDSASSR